MPEKVWFVWEKIHRIHPMQNFDVFIYWSSLPDNMPAVGAKYENKDIELVAVEKDFLNSGRVIAEKIKANPAWLSENLDEMDVFTENYFAVAKKVFAMNLQEKTNPELSAIFREMHDAYFASHRSAAVTIPPEFQTEYISRFVLDCLRKKLEEKKIPIDLGTAFVQVSQPQKESVLIGEKRDFLKLLDTLLANKKLSSMFRESAVEQIENELEKNFADFNALVTAHWKKFEWIFFMYEGPALKKSYFVKELKENLDKGMYIAMELEQNKKALLQQTELLAKLCDNKESEHIFSFSRRLVETKAFRKDAMYFGSYVFEKLFLEIGKRISASIDQIRYMTRDELFSALEGKFSDFKQLDERLKYSVFFAINGETTLLVGKEAKKWFKENVKKEEIVKSNELKGMSAFPGFVEGKVKLISHPNEMVKMNKGDILVSHATNPNLLPAMVKAAAIVTDVGGITCHAAIVAREFRIPCVVGTKVATQVLKDGDLIQVDADNGIIKKLF